MPPKRGASALPRPVAVIKEELEANKIPFTAEGIKATNYETRKKAFSSLNNVLKNQFPDKHADYQKLTDDNLRREWLVAFTLDPQSGGGVAYEKTERKTSSLDKAREVWLTLDEYGGPKYLNKHGARKDSNKAIDRNRP